MRLSIYIFAFVLICLLDVASAFALRSSGVFRGTRIKPVYCEAEHAGPELLKETVSFMEIRAGKVVEVGLHPEAENLYVEKVDCGEESGPRTIVSGLSQFCTLEEMTNRDVIVLCNLKPRALKGIVSAGMLLCASNEDHTKV